MYFQVYFKTQWPLRLENVARLHWSGLGGTLWGGGSPSPGLRFF